jgi:hypothetical protein
MAAKIGLTKSSGAEIGSGYGPKPMTITVVSPALSAALRAAFLLNLKIRHDLVLYLPTTFLSATNSMPYNF